MKLILMLLILVLVPPCFAQTPEFRSESYVALKDYFERIFTERDKYFSFRFEAAQNALTLSRNELDRRLAELNELRASVERDRVQFVKLETFQVKTGAYDNMLSAFEKRITVIETEGRWQATLWAGGVSLFFFVVMVSMRLWDKKKVN